MAFYPKARYFRYRPDIDGLRALAILSVLLFHAAPAWLPGGFVGVDIFFVISGFVITSVVLRDMAENRFSLKRFWARRARRIVPPLLPVLLTALLIGWYLLMPREFLKFGTSLASQAIFGSNFHFLHNSGYFAAPAQTKLLLHTWSLSVEEQFYIAYPLVMLLLMRLKRPLWFILVLLLASLAVSVGLTLSRPTAAFYLPQSRAWELLLGATIAFHVAHEHHWHAPRWLREILAWTGLLLMALSLFMLDHNTRFPGAAALLPCLGAALFIYANTHTHTTPGQLFSLRPVVYIGLISYSLYLWHWPLLVLAHNSGTDHPALAIGGALLAALVLSAASFHLLETPIRKRRWIASDRTLLRTALASLALVALIGKAIAVDKGVLSRFSDRAAALYTRSQEKYPGCASQRRTELGILCLHNIADRPAAFAVWGDSHLGALWPAIDAIAAQRRQNYLLVGCPPVAGVYLTNQATRLADYPCARINERLIQHAGEFPVIAMIARWAVYAEGHDPAALDARNPEMYYGDARGAAHNRTEGRRLFASHFRDTVKRLLANGAQKLVILRQVPEYPFWVPNELTRHIEHGAPLDRLDTSLASHRRRQHFVDRVFDSVAQPPRVTVLDPASVLCHDSQCDLMRDGQSLYRDDDHLSIFGASLLRPMLARELPRETAYNGPHRPTASGHNRPATSPPRP